MCKTGASALCIGLRQISGLISACLMEEKPPHTGCSTAAGTGSDAHQGRHTDASIISHKIDFSVSHNDKGKKKSSAC